jgi:hypothetical protein
MIVTTPGPARPFPGAQSLCPADPGYQTRGELQFYSDSRLGDAGILPAALTLATPATPDDFIRVLNEHNDRVFLLSLISTIAVTGSALITAFRTIRLMSNDRK